MAEATLKLAEVPGLHPYPNGQVALSGPLLRLSQRIDRLFLRWAAEVDAEERAVPTFIPTTELARLDYFGSFPHLVTFPVTLDPAEDNLRRFVADGPLGPSGEVRLARAAPIRDALTPAACYHFYVQSRGDTLTAPRHLTTRATCFRREACYAPLERQWSFSMREIVCMGTAEEVQAFLSRYRARIDRFFRAAGLDVAWTQASDPFFRPASNPKYLVQKLEPIKTEMVLPIPASPANPGGQLAIGSVNFHRSYFGEAFGIRRGSADAFSGCVAFGVERWVYAFLLRFGPDERSWSDLAAWEA
jgi:seryl-tRNA synthetase